jgi:hypothetical protein
VAKGHYGNPARGCLPDEDVVPAGTGHVCAPKIGTKLGNGNASLPTPKCKLGGASPSSNGCPVDANVAKSSAWPICLANGDGPGGYERGEFHCLLVCPCNEGTILRGECGAESHAHCPLGARCERGELRKRDQGVCSYPKLSEGSSLVV